MFKINYNPDVLSCLANLSNDEVFTQNLTQKFSRKARRGLRKGREESIFSQRTLRLLGALCVKSNAWEKDVRKYL